LLLTSLPRLVDKKELAPLEELINGLVAAQK
jgi:hypothetical protein